MTKLVWGAASDRGQVRQANEDFLLAAELGGRERASVVLLAIADGMGGYQAGEVASQMAIHSVHRHLESKVADWPSPEDGEVWLELLRGAMRQANQEILLAGNSNNQYSGMGTTMTAALVVNDRLYVGHVGDSRLYHLGSGELHQITNDHSLVGELVRTGELTADEAMTHPQRNLVLRALGTDWDVAIDTASLELSIGDTLLLCTDGLSNLVRASELEDALQSDEGVEWTAHALVSEANARGGYDNVSVIVARIQSDSNGGGTV
ncbi:MAG: Stp1/IreP family PP2C-type Ser/Thr phosphatase [Bacillota bacterium]